MKDKAGLDILAGQWIVYGHALGRCAGLQYGVVLGVKPSNRYGAKKGDECLIVQGVNTDWKNYKPRLMKKGTLHFGERILCVFPIQVPEPVRKLLGTVKVDP